LYRYLRQIWTFHRPVLPAQWLNSRHTSVWWSSSRCCSMDWMKPLVSSYNSLLTYHFCPGRSLSNKSASIVCVSSLGCTSNLVFTLFALCIASLRMLLNQWRQQIYNVIDYDTTHIGTDGSSNMNIANMYINTWTECEGHFEYIWLLSFMSTVQ